VGLASTRFFETASGGQGVLLKNHPLDSRKTFDMVLFFLSQQNWHGGPPLPRQCRCNFRFTNGES